ncbi:ATP-grasp domain-containing protein [Erwinia aphidicola]|uniref:ATP-grasp domain-containing protein n=1 Tax=Erwinia aphidicola TaxID=68334 RepID=UPI00300C532B
MMRLVIIGIRKTGTSLTLVDTALNRGIDVTIISNPEDKIDGIFSPVVVIEYITSSVSIITNWIKGNYPTPESTLRITTLNDVYACVTAQVNSALNLPGPDVLCVSRAVSKHQQKKIFSANKIPTSGFWKISLSELEKKSEILDKLEFPVVVKPSEGTASNGVKLCNLYSEVISHLNFLAEQKNLRPDLVPSDIILLEEYLPGAEYCVEYFDGKYVGAIRKSKRYGNDFFERGYTSELNIDEKALRNLIETGSRAVEAAGLNWGPVHIDCIVNDGLASIIEMNPRIAGSFICDIVRDAYSFDMIENLLNKLQGKDVTVPVKFIPDAYACVNFFLESDPLPWAFAESGELKNDIIHITYGPQHLRNRNRRAYVYTKILMRTNQLETD